MQPVAVGVYPGGGSHYPPSNMAILPIRSPHTVEALHCPPWQEHPQQHNSTHHYSPHYSTELPPGSVSVLHPAIEGRYLPVSPPVEGLSMPTACQAAEVNLCTLPRLPVTGTHSQPDIVLHPVHSGGPQCTVLETSFIESSCPPVGDTGSLSSPVALQHYLPANIEKELLTLNAAMQDTFQVADTGMPSDRKWEEMVARHFVDQASLVLEATLSGNVQKIELQRTSIPGFFASLQEDGACDMYFSYQGCQIDINSPISSVNCTKATLVISYTKPVAFKVFAHGVLSLKYHEKGLKCQESGLGQHRLQLLSFVIGEHEEFVERSVLRQLLEEERGRVENPLGGSPKAPPLTSELTLSGFTERTWQFLRLHCCSVRSDVTPDGPQSVPTPMEPQTYSPYDLPYNEAETSCHTPILGGGGDNDTVFSNSPTTDDPPSQMQENGTGNGKQSSASYRKRTRSHSAAGEGATKSRKHKRRPSSSSSSQRKHSYTMLVVEEPVKLSECDVQADVRQIVKIERFTYESLSDTKATEAASFVEQLKLPLTGHNQSGNEPLQDNDSPTSGSV